MCEKYKIMPTLIEQSTRTSAADHWTRAGEWIRYSTPDGAKYMAICLPAFSPDTVHRDP